MPKDRAGKRRPIRVGMNPNPPKKKFDPQPEIDRLHALWVASGGKEGYPDDDKIKGSGVLDKNGKMRKNLELRTDNNETDTNEE